MQSEAPKLFSFCAIILHYITIIAIIFSIICIIPEQKVARLIPEINEEIKGLYSQWDEIIIKKAIPKEIGEDLMLQALDTTRNARSNLMKQKMELSDKNK